MPQQELIGIQQGVLEVVETSVTIADFREMCADQIALASRWTATERQQVNQFRNFIIALAGGEPAADVAAR